MSLRWAHSGKVFEQEPVDAERVGQLLHEAVRLRAQIQEDEAIIDQAVAFYNTLDGAQQAEFNEFREIAKNGVPISYAGPPSAASGEVLSTNIVPNAFQRVLVDDIDPAEAVADIHRRIAAVYERRGRA